jgi:hypothetical protein
MPHGGPRPGGGRPKGSKNKRTQEIVAAGRAAISAIAEPFEGDSVALFQLVYKDTSLPLAIRINAASLAAKFERPTMVMSKTVLVEEMSIEARRERVLELLGRHRLIDVEAQDAEDGE